MNNLFALMLLFSLLQIQAYWWISTSEEEYREVCRRMPRRTPQHRMCARDGGRLVKTLLRGAQRGRGHCQGQFEDSKWNCTVDAHWLVKGQSTDTRETAYLISMISAGAMHEIGSACYRGDLNTCSCLNSYHRTDKRTKPFQPTRKEIEQAELDARRTYLASKLQYSQMNRMGIQPLPPCVDCLTQIPLQNNTNLQDISNPLPEIRSGLGRPVATQPKINVTNSKNSPNIPAMSVSVSTREIRTNDLQTRAEDTDANPTSITWEWRGCGDGINFSVRKTRNFFEGTKKRKRKKNGGKKKKNKRRKGKKKWDVRKEVRSHNRELGQKVVKAQVHIACKCHGVSGSCTHISCWRKMQPLATAAKELYQKYKTAIRVRSNNRYRGGLLKVDDLQKPPKGLLVYYDSSPDYCKRDLQVGSYGTAGRSCVPGESCKSLCCNRGHRALLVQRNVKCMCRFQFCCSVKCSWCSVRREEAYCN